MRRSVIREYDKLAEALSSHSGVFAYRLRNLCVKAEEVSLLPIEVLIEGELQKLEQCTTIGKDDEYSFMIIPHYDEDMGPLGQSIAVAHPEFKQKIETMTVDTVDENANPKQADVRYIRVIMPEVDNDRYDVLKDGVKVCYEECKAQMEAANMKADAQLALLTVGESEEDMKKLKAERDKLNEQWNSHRDRIYEEKLKEIEDAHNKWLTEKAHFDAEREEDEAAHNKSAAYSMRLNQEDE